MPDRILIAGAGPTGLVLALSLVKSGVAVRIISLAKGPGEQSRAMAVHARTLEFYQQFGFADEVVTGGVIMKHAHLREGQGQGQDHEVAQLSFIDMDAGTTPFPFVLAYPQDDHERLLVGKLKAAGVDVEWDTRLISFKGFENHLEVTLQSGERSETVETEWLCGCDGAHSAVREELGIGFAGGTYEQKFFVADVKVAGGFQPDLTINLGAHGLALMLPVRSSGMQRLIGLIPEDFSKTKDLSFTDLKPEVEALLNTEVTEVNWFSEYRVHHRVADRFRAGRVFLLGDAAHVHSPVGGQGMNTGIGDAINLAWKLAAVVSGRQDADLLDSYEPERIGFARELVATTDRAFTPMIDEGLLGAAMRRIAMPALVGLVSNSAPLRHAAFRLLSQTGLHYRNGPLSEGHAGAIHGGDRLPWTGHDGPDNYAPLATFHWQVHVHGSASPALSGICRAHDLPLRVFPFSETASKGGYKRNAAYLVRPDGYVGLAVDAGAESHLEAYCQRLLIARRD